MTKSVQKAKIHESRYLGRLDIKTTQEQCFAVASSQMASEFAQRGTSKTPLRQLVVCVPSATRNEE